MKIAFLFSGQGTQCVGMGQELYENYLESKCVFDIAQSILSWDVKEVCFEDQNAIINKTRYTQAALFTTTIATYEIVKAKGIEAEAMLGFSLGEWSALVASGILTFEDALKLVDKRAMYMDMAAEETEGAMAAVIGIDASDVRDTCKEIVNQGDVLALANDNCPGQVVISGEKVAIEKATSLLQEKGAKRVMPLKVSGAFHSPLMQKAADRLKLELDDYTFHSPHTPLISNVSADYMDQEEAKKNIPTQIVEGVRFRESINRLLEEGFDTFIEIGVGKTLCGLVRKTSREVKVFNIENVATLEKVLTEIGGEGC